ncbi:SAM-dependent methyltransferase [Paenibacillaceae bacterium WGS1546]|uniref:SAM-dependent methyltransferase n=1 Tax=Cohnella sp. WGS1546 TaxID=3366810 RepID=UPI00372D707D
MTRGAFASRATKPELMDDATQGGEELREALRHLGALNRIFGASGPLLYGVGQLWRQLGKPRRLTLLDVGSGSGELNRALLRWAERNRVDLIIVLADITEEARAEAERLYRQDSRVSFAKRDLFDLPSGSADIVTASQFVHHFPTERLPAVVERLLDIAKSGVVVNDIHRHWLPWTAVWIATRLISGNRYIRHDGPLSVAKGFKAGDFRQLRKELDQATIRWRWRPLFRYSVILIKKEGE